MRTIACVTGTEVKELDSPQVTMLDGMIHAQDCLGQITWDVVTYSVTLGTVNGGDDDRVAVFDLDLADGMDVIRATNWALGHTDEVPELRAELAR